MTPKKIQVAICDPSPTIRYGLQHVLSTDPDISIVAEVATHEEMLDCFSDIDLDIALVEIGEDREAGFNCIRQFLETRPEVKIIIFTGYSTDMNTILKAIDSGVQGYQLKQADCKEILNAIQIVHKGGSSLAPIVVTKMLERMQSKHPQMKSALSKREQEVLELITLGKTNSDIASTLLISVRTVKFHVSSILTKLNVKNRTEAALKNSIERFV